MSPSTEDRRPAEEWESWDPAGDDEGFALVDLVNRLLDRGVVLTGEVTISVAGVDLVYLGLNAVLTSVTTARSAIASRTDTGTEPGTSAGE